MVSRGIEAKAGMEDLQELISFRIYKDQIARALSSLFYSMALPTWKWKPKRWSRNDTVFCRTTDNEGEFVAFFFGDL
jgi:hypothetical protein